MNIKPLSLTGEITVDLDGNFSDNPKLLTFPTSKIKLAIKGNGPHKPVSIEGSMLICRDIVVFKDEKCEYHFIPVNKFDLDIFKFLYKEISLEDLLQTVSQDSFNLGFDKGRKEGYSVGYDDHEEYMKFIDDIGG